jgi:DNA-binding transcriptional MerR regulator
VDFAHSDKEYFRIGEVSSILGVEPYVIRFWESEFRSVKPVRTGSDQRRYRRKDIEQLLLIKKLLYEDGFTIAGARKRLAEIKKEQKHPAEIEPDTSADPLDRMVRVKKILQELKEILG